MSSQYGRTKGQHVIPGSNTSTSALALELPDNTQRRNQWQPGTVFRNYDRIASIVGAETVLGAAKISTVIEVGYFDKTNQFATTNRETSAGSNTQENSLLSDRTPAGARVRVPAYTQSQPCLDAWNDHS